jgi:7,8-dihydropterin-6-yl-methyl-4-(beta-D-ribofuranosyl)aminobenzene 5'-phosphate synthase
MCIYPIRISSSNATPRRKRGIHERNIKIKAVDRVEILTLQDNTIDLVQQDNSAVIQRAMPLVGLEVKNSILAEHGFSSMITVTDGGRVRCMLFDFGFSEQGAAYNADALGADLTVVEEMALSHGHLDHVGGIGPLVEKTGKRDIPLVLHPAAFRNPRFLKISDDFKVYFPAFTRDKAEAAGAAVIDTDKPYPMLDHAAAFLGQIPRTTAFEQGTPNLFCEIDGQERQDPFDDDSAMVFNVRDKGLVVVSGCAHAGIVNTVAYARQVTGVDKVMAVMGGFPSGRPGCGTGRQTHHCGIEGLEADLRYPHPLYRQAGGATDRKRDARPIHPEHVRDPADFQCLMAAVG